MCAATTVPQVLSFCKSAHTVSKLTFTDLQCYYNLLQIWVFCAWFSSPEVPFQLTVVQVIKTTDFGQPEMKMASHVTYKYRYTWTAYLPCHVGLLNSVRCNLPLWLHYKPLHLLYICYFLYVSSGSCQHSAFWSNRKTYSNHFYDSRQTGKKITATDSVYNYCRDLIAL